MYTNDINPMHELAAVIVAWLKREGDLRGLLAAWLEVVTGQVPTHSIRPSYLTDHSVIVNAIRKHQRTWGSSPTVAQIARAVPLTQKATAAHISTMIANGTAAITIKRPHVHGLH